jgi:hypothetical protein
MSALLTGDTRPQVASASRKRHLTVYRTVRPDLVEVVVGPDVVGFIEVVGPVFVALSGPRYDRAVEVAQSVSIEVAHRALCGAA